MSQVTETYHFPDDAPTKQARAVFGFDDCWPPAYGQYKPQFDAANDLTGLADEMMKADEATTAKQHPAGGVSA
jgi:hypothetical protein